jgi:hypothetical protein
LPAPWAARKAGSASPPRTTVSGGGAFRAAYFFDSSFFSVALGEDEGDGGVVALEEPDVAPEGELDGELEVPAEGELDGAELEGEELEDDAPGLLPSFLPQALSAMAAAAASSSTFFIIDSSRRVTGVYRDSIHARAYKL